MRFQTLLFHTRFRELAFNSLKSILELKAVGLKKVVLAHVIPREEVSFVPYGGILKDYLHRLQEEARLKFDDWIQTIGDAQLTFSQRVEVGSANARILDMAVEEKVDLIVVGRKKRTALEKVYVGTHGATMIVMGRTGKDWFQEYWLGGVSHQVAELSELPVLLIP